MKINNKSRKIVVYVVYVVVIVAVVVVVVVVVVVKREAPVPGPPELHLKDLKVNLKGETVIVDTVSDACFCRLSFPYICLSSQSDCRSCVLHRLARVKLTRSDHLVGFQQF